MPHHQIAVWCMYSDLPCPARWQVGMSPALSAFNSGVILARMQALVGPLVTPGAAGPGSMRGPPRRSAAGSQRLSSVRRNWTVLGSVLAAVVLVGLYFSWSGKDDDLVDYNRFLPTKWTYQVPSTKPLPEYPRPQLVRQQWQNLNGQWQLEATTKTGLTTPPFGRALTERVLVPFPVQSMLSGIQRHLKYMWYRTEFTVPSAWASQRIYLHFGAVDWQSTVYINRKELGTHKGGYNKFSYDITDILRSSSHGVQELVVGVYDPTEKADGVPVGKQRESVPGNRVRLCVYLAGTE